MFMTFTASVCWPYMTRWQHIYSDVPTDAAGIALLIYVSAVVLNTKRSVIRRLKDSNQPWKISFRRCSRKSH